MFTDVSAGEDARLVKRNRPEDKSKRKYHKPIDRLLNTHSYGRYAKAPGPVAQAVALPRAEIIITVAPLSDGGYMSNIEKSIDQTIDKCVSVAVARTTGPSSNCCH
jgi:hypothetical protein